MKNFVHESGITLSLPGTEQIMGPSFEDNQGPIVLSANHINSAWSKRTVVQFHFLSELLRA